MTVHDMQPSYTYGQYTHKAQPSLPKRHMNGYTIMELWSLLRGKFDGSVAVRAMYNIYMYNLYPELIGI